MPIWQTIQSRVGKVELKMNVVKKTNEVVESKDKEIMN